MEPELLSSSLVPLVLVPCFLLMSYSFFGLSGLVHRRDPSVESRLASASALCLCACVLLAAKPAIEGLLLWLDRSRKGSYEMIAEMEV